MEHFRLNWFGRFAETQFRLVPQSEVYAFRNPDPWSDGEDRGGPDYYEDGPYAQGPGWLEDPRQYAPPARRQAQPERNFRWWWEDEAPRRPRRVDPDYLWRNGQVY